MATEEVQNQDELQDFTDDRGAQIEAMAKSREAQVKEDRVEIPDDGDWEEVAAPEEEEEAPAEEPEGEKSWKDDDAESMPEDHPPIPETEVRKFRVKVDGEEWEITKDDLLAKGLDPELFGAEKAVSIYQREIAIDRRLQSSREELGKIKAFRAELQAPKEQPKTAEDIQNQLAALSKKSLEATDENEFAAVELEKAQLYREMFRAEMAERESANQSRQEHQSLLERHNALKAKVAEKHPDYERIGFAGQDQFGRPILQPRLEEWLSKQPRSVRWALLESEDPIDPISVFDRYKSDTGLVQVQSMEDRKARKQNLDTPPSASRKAAKPETETREPSPSQIVAAMKKARGMTGEDL